MKALSTLLVLTLGLMTHEAVAEAPRLVHANVQNMAVTSSLSETVAQVAASGKGPLWVGYAEPIIDGTHHICCWNQSDDRLPRPVRHGLCRLENRDDGMNFRTNDKDEPDERPTDVLTLIRIEAGRVERIRVFSSDCELDAGGLPVVWLDGVKARESVQFLAQFIPGVGTEGKTSKKLGDAALSSIALQSGDEADAALAGFVELSRPEELRKDTAFWLGNLRGAKGYEVLQRMLQNDPSGKIREQCIFALSISHEPRAIGLMIETARGDKSSQVRGQALFWLSQKAGERAAAAITDAIANDPETEVKKKAVFALSQLPKNEGVPRLVDVARKNRNAVVRKEAMFWLGQSNDDRALAFFEETLTKR